MFLIYLGILLLSAATLLFEITLTRVFSVAQWYHFAFMVVSLALLGFGASGSFLSLFPGLVRKDLSRLLAVFAALFSLGCLGGYLVINTIPFDSYRVALEGRQILYLVVYYLSLAIPFFFTGLVVGIALSQMPSRAGKLYGFNMLGSGLGCLLVLVSPSYFGGGGTVVLAAFLGVGAVFVFSLPRLKIFLSFAILAGIGLIVLLVNSPAVLEIGMSPYKSLSQILRHSQAQTLWTEWNAFSRVDVVRSRSIHLAPGLSFNYTEGVPSQLGVTMDGENLSPMIQIEIEEADFTRYLPSALVYYLSPRPKTLIVEPGGGLDVVTALHHECDSVVAVFSNPLVVEAIERFGGRGQFLDNPKVEVATQGVRSYLKGSEERFEVVQVSLGEGFQPVVVGAYSLTENYLYTLEAIKEYYHHLAPGGLLSLTRWIQVPPSEGIRLMSVVATALEDMGIAHPEERLAAIRSFQTITLLVKETPFTSEDVSIIRDFSDKRGFDTVYFPGISAADLNRYNVLPDEVYYEAFTDILSARERQASLGGYPYDISPVTDDRPFFFHFFKWSQVPSIWQGLGKTWQPFGGAGYLMVLVLLLVAMLASALFILLPLYVRPGARVGRNRLFVAGVRPRVFIYFMALGLGFLFIEIPLMQKFILFLDEPTYAFAVVLFTILVFSGVGSLFSEQLIKVLPRLILGLGLLVLFYPLILPSFFEALLWQPLIFRLLAAVVLLAPLSFLMGIPFPSGIRLIGISAPQLVPWAWGVNGCFSVVSSILSLVIALSVGFSWVLVIAGGVYLVGAAVIWRWMEETKKLSGESRSVLT